MLFRVSADARDRTDGRRFDFALGWIEFTLRRTTRATGNRDREQNGAGGQQFWSVRFQPGGMQPPSCEPAKIPSTKRCTNDRHDNDSVSTRAVLELPIKMEFREKRGDHGRKI
ncbi:hypothetical protein LMTR3_08245 [Bradyrhizobium sp. LMTR 3]|nr:hypothetical protein LMTR3_08245 [Bradyrhizobium sp. LMTR 3]